MVKLNHKVKIDNEMLTPYLVSGGYVYCINNSKDTTILPIEKFDVKQKKRHLVVPKQSHAPIVPVALAPKPVPPKEEIITIKKTEDTYVPDSGYLIKFSGKAITSCIANEVIIPPVVDNSRYVRPTLDDEYI